MLKDILRVINDTGMVNMAEIAEQTETTESMVEQAIAVLVSKGYLALVNDNPNCETYRCAGCGVHCAPKQQTKSCYLVTEKGKAYLHSS
jgi:predicted transcriptional regulator